ncbi:MAG TPA: FAD-binding oxidoreductase [Micromonosporaceae bacterium]|nr:FAD-binding oxidoreductase [Micromonosporaceae bacterium]
MTGGRLLTGWGGTAPTRATVLSSGDGPALAEAVRYAGERGVIARGLGRSYGDAACNGGGIVVNMTARADVLAWDLDRGLISVEAGLSLNELLALAIPHGWFVPVLPGTGQVTIGGAISADVHGKNHHAGGTFCRHVASFDLLTADGLVRTVTPNADFEVFWATAGGMGLTGLVLRATVRLVQVETAWMVVDTERAADLDTVLAELADGDERYPYSAAWVDLGTGGARTGRGVLTRGRHARRDDLPPAMRSGSLLYRPRHQLTVPPGVPRQVLNRCSLSMFNEAWYRRAPRHRRGELQPMSDFLYPLDAVGRWNRLYGSRGFVQYQFVLPFGAEVALRRVVAQITASKHAPFLAVLKRLGSADPGPLSFPIAGWTLALDLAASPELGPLLDQLDDLVAEAGGRVYLAKDARMRASVLPRMYSRLDDFRAIREALDPRRVFNSDLARRLAL